MVLEKFTEFLDSSPTIYHASLNIAARLEKKGFTLLKESDTWALQPGKSYYLVREGTLLTAFRLPSKKPKSAVLLANHIDSPALRLKPSQSKLRLHTELYGAPLLYTWLDRDLVIAGRVFTETKDKKRRSHLLYLQDHPVVIPSLAIHLERKVNEEGLKIQKEEHLKAIYSLSEKSPSFEELLQSHFPKETYLNSDLYLVPKEKASFLGFEKEMISSYRIDNLSSAFSCLEAMIQASQREDVLQMALFWDHEEIGSQSYSGADSTFLSELLERILLSYKMGKEEFFRLKSSSFCLSCDAAHAYHPNYKEKFDKENAPHMGKGPALKFSPRYATTAHTAAVLTSLSLKHKIPLQTYASHADIPTGSTVGAMMAANSGIMTVDLGAPCFAMHSSRETIAVKDQIELTRLLTACLEEI